MLGRTGSRMELTKQALTKICRDNGLYSSPALNDKLYLHYKVIKIEKQDGFFVLRGLARAMYLPVFVYSFLKVLD